MALKDVLKRLRDNLDSEATEQLDPEVVENLRRAATDDYRAMVTSPLLEEFENSADLVSEAVLTRDELVEMLAEAIRRSSQGTGPSNVDEDEFERYGYRSRIPIEIRGERIAPGSNVVIVGGARVKLGDRPFTLFLRLVVELFRNKSGMVYRSDLAKEGYLNSADDHQGVRRVREPFGPALGKLDPTEFIEARESKTLRLSTSRALVSYRKVPLFEHPAEQVRCLTGQLPDPAGGEGSSGPGEDT